MHPFSAAPHGDVLVLLAQLAVLLFAARALGEVAQRLGQPAVVGEILAGILLGPSLLGAIAPALLPWTTPQTALQGHLLEVVSLLGVMFLLLVTGLETDLPLIQRHAKVAISVAAGGLFVPLLCGFALGQVLPERLLAAPDRRLVFSLFVATALSISAIPVISKVLMDLKLMRRDIGQTIIAAGMIDDTTGWILLSIIAGLARGEAVTAVGVFRAFGTVVAFLVVSYTATRWLVKRSLDFVQDEIASEERLLTLVIVLTFAWGAVSQALELEAMLGAFVMGVLFGQMPRLPQFVRHRIESLTIGIFAPIFFAVAGLKVNLASLADPHLAAYALLVIVVATFAKVAGTYVGSRLVGQDHWTALAYGAGLNARGAMEIIVATIGLRLGILSQDMFSIIVLMAMVTSLMAPTALRWALSRVEPAEEELRRLRQEELAAGSPIAAVHRVLLPVRPQDGRRSAVRGIEAVLLERIGTKSRLSITLMTVASNGRRPDSATELDSLARLFTGHEVNCKVVENSRSPVDAILEEARKDYDLLVLGATEAKGGSESLFTPLVDTLVRVAPCPTIVVNAANAPEGWQPRRILVPTNGSLAARHAAETAFLLATPEDEVIVLNVVVESRTTWRHDSLGRTFERQLGIARQLVAELREIGESRGVRTSGEVRTGADPESAIVELARSRSIDLVVLGTDVRPGSDRLFFGPRVERMLTLASCPVIVVNV